MIGSILNASLTYYAFHRYQNDRVTLREAFGQGVGRFLSVLGASLILGLIVAGLLLVPLGFVIAGTFSRDVCLIGTGGLLLLALLPIVLYVYIALALYLPAIMIEEKTAIESLKRSWELTRGRRWAVFGGLFVITLISGVLGAIATVPFAFAQDGYIRAIGTIISTTITGSWTIIFAAVAYRLIKSQLP